MEECSKAFEAVKQLLVKAPVLAHFDPDVPIRLAGDASAYGLEAVISHVYNDGAECPIVFASRMLLAAERNYAQLEKEALSLVYGTKIFHQYLYGRTFELVMDHKPLTTLLDPKHGIPVMAAARLQRWALWLLAYSYTITFRHTHEHANADGLSRLPLGTREAPALTCNYSFTVGQIQALPLTADQIATATRRDSTLSKVLMYVTRGWSTAASKAITELRNYLLPMACRNKLFLTTASICIRRIF